MYYEIRNSFNTNQGQFTTKESALRFFNNHWFRNNLIENIANGTNIKGTATIEDLEKGFAGCKLITIK